MAGKEAERERESRRSADAQPATSYKACIQVVGGGADNNRLLIKFGSLHPGGRGGCWHRSVPAQIETDRTSWQQCPVLPSCSSPHHTQ